jgi:redox-sensitive bicupin YhaK (pirin superfamily)
MLELVIEQRRRDLGGLEIGRVLPDHRRRRPEHDRNAVEGIPRSHNGATWESGGNPEKEPDAGQRGRGAGMVGPFIFFDHLGPQRMPAGIAKTVDVRPHPHIGLSTVTYLFDGEVMHRDSVASEVAIRPGEVNWMVAGRGITHSERFERARARGDNIHGIQSWVALPTQDEETTPEFAHYGSSELPLLEDGGLSMRLIAGAAFGVKSPVKTHSPLFYVHWVLAPRALAQLPRNYPERAAYIVSGQVEAEGQVFEAGHMLVFAKGAAAEVRAITPTVLMGLGGEPLGERHIEWNFVSSSQERIEQAKADWRAGRMKLPDFDDGEFIPLPTTSPEPPTPPM